MQSDYSKSPPARHYSLENIEAIFGGFPEERHTQSHDAKSKSSLPSNEGPTAGKVGKLLRAWWSKSPWDDYTQVAYLHSSQRVRLVYQRETYFDLAVMREQPPGFDDVVSFRTLLGIHHPNIAKTYDIYFHDEKTFVVIEHLDLSLA